MAIRKETTGTEELIRDNRYHRAALLSDPETAHLAAATKTPEDALRKASHVQDEKEGERAEKLAVFIRSDFQLDTRLKYFEADVFGVCNRSRSDDRYKDIFPRGLAAVIALRGEDEKKAVEAALAAAHRHFPDIEKKYKKELETLAAHTAQAEKDRDAAETAADQAMLDEFAARRTLVRQLQKNEGALLTLFPGDKARVRSYFRPQKRTRDEEPGEGGGGNPPPNA